MASYAYSQLKEGEIRLLILAPAKASTPSLVNCSIIHRHLLSSELKFDALSYCWGSSNKTKQVFCTDGDEAISVTESLFSALRNLSLEHEERCVWADAICINQDDDEEKNRQVSMMGQIYTAAKKTVVWLGEDKEAEAAIAQVGEIHDMPSLKWLDHGESLRDSIRAVAPIFESPWFRRLWVVQEVALAAACDMTAGRKHVTLDQMEHVIWRLPGLYEHQDLFDSSSAVNFQNMCELRYSLRAGGPRSKLLLLELLRMTEWFQVSNKKDRIYALLGLAARGVDADANSSKRPSSFPANYDTSYSHENMFVDFAVWALSEFPNLALLSFASGADTSHLGPSWAPSYGMCNLPISLLQVPHFSAWGGEHQSEGNDDGEGIASGKGARPLFELEGGRILCLAGVFVDTVKTVLHAVLNAALPSHRRSELDAAREWARHPASSGGRPTHASGRERKFAAALILELDRSWGRASDCRCSRTVPSGGGQHLEPTTRRSGSPFEHLAPLPVYGAYRRRPVRVDSGKG